MSKNKQLSEDDGDIRLIIPRTMLKRNNSKYLPNDDYIRCLIVGPSKCGKTTLMFDNILLYPGRLDKKKTYVFLQNLYKETETMINEKMLLFVITTNRFYN